MVKSNIKKYRTVNPYGDVYTAYSMIGVITFMIIGFCYWIGGIDVRTETLLNQVGDTLIVNTDTLVIKDYNLQNQTYILSNNKEVSVKYVQHIKQTHNDIR